MGWLGGHYCLSWVMCVLPMPSGVDPSWRENALGEEGYCWFATWQGPGWGTSASRAGMAAGASTAGPQHLPLAKVWKTEVEVRMGAQRVRGPPRPGVEVRKLPSLHCAGWRRNK